MRLSRARDRQAELAVCNTLAISQERRRDQTALSSNLIVPKIYHSYLFCCATTAATQFAVFY